jgi:hypothetical protein
MQILVKVTNRDTGKVRKLICTSFPAALQIASDQIPWAGDNVSYGDNLYTRRNFTDTLKDGREFLYDYGDTEMSIELSPYADPIND